MSKTTKDLKTIKKGYGNTKIKTNSLFTCKGRE